MNALTTTPDGEIIINPMGALAEALAKAQGELKNPYKDKTAQIKSDKGSFSYSYVTLADGLEIIRSALSKHGLAVTQTTQISGEQLILETRLLHTSGASIGSDWPLGRIGSLTPQQMGSALTYGRRYTLFPLVGIAGDDDDDGHAASKSAPPKAPAPPMARLSVKQVQEIEALMFKLPSADSKSFLKWAGVASVAYIAAEKYAATKEALEKKLASLGLLAQLQASVKATQGFDFDAFRATLEKAKTLDELNLSYDKELTGVIWGTEEEADEADGILRELAARFWEEGN